jgi:curli biogenesis system outer membrane secretion channel CsgG
MTLFSTAVKTLTVAITAIAISGCASTSANVVSSGNSGTISDFQRAPIDGPRRRIAVTDFAFHASRNPGTVGKGMSDMLVDSLFNTNQFIVLERDRLDEVMAEQDNANSERFRKDTVAAIGQLEGAELLIKGSIIQFEPSCSGGSLILISAKKACVAINLRIIDATTGRIVNSTTVEGTSTNKGVGIIYTKSSLPIGLGAWSNTPMEKAIRNAIEAAVQHIANTRL